MPDLRVVSERSEQEIKKQEAAAALKQALTALTANLIRIVRGAGKPDFIAEHLRDVAVAYANYCDIDVRGVPADVIRDMLRFEMSELPENQDRVDMIIAEHAICRAGLQVAASALVQQDRQRDNGLLDLHRALDLRDRFRAARERQRRKEAKLTKPYKR